MSRREKIQQEVEWQRGQCGDSIFTRNRADHSRLSDIDLGTAACAYGINLTTSRPLSFPSSFSFSFHTY